MLKKWMFLSLILISFLTVAQTSTDYFKILKDSLKQQNNFSEYIYAHLDEFVKKPTTENLDILKTVENSLWRNPKTTIEATALLYYYVNYAYYLKQFGLINESVVSYEKAYNCYKKNKIPNYDIVEYCLKPLANNYTRLGDADRAEDILKIYIEQAQKNNNVEHLVSGYLNLSIVLRTKGEIFTANNYLNLALELTSSKQSKSFIYSNLAVNYLFINDLNNAEKYVSLSSQLNVEKDLKISVKNETTLGSCFLKKNELDKALYHFEKGFKNAKTIFGKNDREVAKVMLQIAEVYKRQNNYEESLLWYDKSINILLPKFSSNNSKTYLFYPENTLKEAFDGKSIIFSEIGDYQSAIKNYELAFLIENELRATYLTQNSKLLQQQENRDRSEKCIELCNKLYIETNEVKWLEKAFEFAEKTKSAVLLEAKELAMEKTLLKNDSIFIKEKNTLFEKAQLNKSIALEELKGEDANINVLSRLTLKRDEAFNELQLIKEQIRIKYPNLSTQNNDETLLRELKEKLIKNNELIIEFFDGTNNIYVFSISKNKPIKLHTIPKSEKLINEINHFLSFFEDSRGVKLQNNIQHYKLLGYQLFHNFFRTELHKNVILIPDGLLSFIPFDALLTKQSEHTNFGSLPYLIKSTTINYSYSAKIALQNLKTADKFTNDKILGFFPIFENNFRGLTELDFTLKEASNIKNVINGDFFIKSNATKNNFLQNSHLYPIVHLSTHALAGNNYSPPSIEFYDETLYLPEIYGYNLQTNLLVLSACETGVGTLRRGEGAMSMARAFSYAGVKSLIVSLWKVNDKATEILMTDFYKKYKKSKNKSESLHNAKLEYLKNDEISSLKKSPYYWASFVYFGDSIIDDKKNSYIGWLILIGIIFAIGYFLLKKSRFDSK